MKLSKCFDMCFQIQGQLAQSSLVVLTNNPRLVLKIFGAGGVVFFLQMVCNIQVSLIGMRRRREPIAGIKTLNQTAMTPHRLTERLVVSGHTLAVHIHQGLLLHSK